MGVSKIENALQTRVARFEAGGRRCEKSGERARDDAPMFAGLCEGDEGPAARVVSRPRGVLCAGRPPRHPSSAGEIVTSCVRAIS